MTIVSFHGLHYGDAVTTFKNKRIVIRGELTIAIRNGKRWGDQFHFKAYSKEIKDETRASTSTTIWAETGICYPMSKMTTMIKLLTLINKIYVEHGYSWFETDDAEAKWDAIWKE